MRIEIGNKVMEWDLDRTIGHGAAITGIVGTLSGFLPIIAAIFGLVWYSIQIFESRTFQHWYRNMQMKRRAKKLARLRAHEKIVLAQIEAIEKVRAAKVEAREIVATATADAAKLVVHENAESLSKPLK